MKENKNTTCDPCEQDFKKSVDKLVNEGRAPSHSERAKRAHEVKAAFDHHTEQADAREHAMAGEAKKIK